MKYDSYIVFIFDIYMRLILLPPCRVCNLSRYKSRLITLMFFVTILLVSSTSSITIANQNTVISKDFNEADVTLIEFDEIET